MVNLAVSFDGLALEFASDNLKNNMFIVKKAIKQNAWSFVFASEKLKKRIKLIKYALKI